MYLTAGQARERVAHGAQFLDRVSPGWASLIDVGTLDLSRPCFCVLGQVYGSFFTAADRLFDHGDRVIGPVAHGFDIQSGDAEYGNEEAAMEAFGLLQDAWVKEIADRVAAEPISGVPAEADHNATLQIV